MQQILNYSSKVERMQHLYQEQGEINRLMLGEEFKEIAERLKEQVVKTEPSDSQNKISDKEESDSNSSNSYHNNQGSKKDKDKKEIHVIEEEHSNIDIKV